MSADSSAPEVTLFDAEILGIDDEALRKAARAISAHRTSRSYTQGLAAVAVWTTDVGIDIERVDDNFDLRLALSIATGEEADSLRNRPPSPLEVARLWSAKEAIAKALGDPLVRDPQRVQAPSNWRSGSSATATIGSGWRMRALVLPTGYVGWVAWRISP